MKVLQICYKLPFPGHDGGEYSIRQNSLGLLKQKEIDLNVLAINQKGKSNNNCPFPNEFIKNTNFKAVSINTSATYTGALLSLFSKKSYFISRYHSKKFETEIISVLNTNKFDIIQLEHVCLGVYIDIIRKYSESKIVLRTQNIEFLLWDSIRRHTTNPLRRKYLQLQIKKLNAFEKQTIKKSDAIITLTRNDENEIRKFNNEIPVKTVPVGFEFNQNKIEQTNNLKPKFYFIGSLDWAPNIQGIHWFIDEIMPVLLLHIPEFELNIAGKNISEKLLNKASKNLVFHQHVKDSVSFISKMDILLVPLISGGGMKVKIMEALCLGKKVTCTGEAFSGFEDFYPFISISNSKQELIEQIINDFHNFKPNSELKKELIEKARLKFDNASTGLETYNLFKSLLIK